MAPFDMLPRTSQAPGIWSALTSPHTFFPRTEGFFFLRTHIETHGQHLPDFRAAGHAQVAGCLAQDVGDIFVRNVDAFRCSGCTFCQSEKKKIK